MKRLYTLPLPAAAQPTATGAERAQLAEAGLLNTDASIVEQLSSDPSELALSGQWRFGRPYARVVATELEELAQASGYETVPLFRAGDGDTDTDTATDAFAGTGYYSVQDASTEPAHAAAEDVYRYDVTLSKAGTHATHFRAVRTNPVDVASDAPFSAGGAETATVAIPAAARKRRWVTPETGVYEPAGAPDDVVASEFGDVARYDVGAGQSALGIDRPTLAYELSFDQAGRVDCTVWDDRDGAKFAMEYSGDRVGSDTLVGEATVGTTESITRWQHVFATSHEFAGRPIIENGRVRLRFDEASGLIRVWVWDSTAGSGAWTQIELTERWNETDWRLEDVDLVTVAPAEVEAQVEFEDTRTGGLYDLDMVLQRGAEWPLWLIPPNESDAVPTGLETLLAPVASGVASDAQPAGGLVKRGDLRR